MRAHAVVYSPLVDQQDSGFRSLFLVSMRSAFLRPWFDSYYGKKGVSKGQRKKTKYNYIYIYCRRSLGWFPTSPNRELVLRSLRFGASKPQKASEGQGERPRDNPWWHRGEVLCCLCFVCYCLFIYVYMLKLFCLFVCLVCFFNVCLL